MEINLTDLTDEELASLLPRLQAEIKARQVISTVETRLQEVEDQAEQKKNNLAANFVFARDRITPESDGTTAPAWVSPTGAHDVYPEGYRVTHNGKTWINTHRANSWEPGTTNSQWIEVTDPAAGEIAWGAGQAVSVGDVRIYEGVRWEAKVAHVTHFGWIPSEFTHAVWKNLGATDPVVEEPPLEEPPAEEPVDPPVDPQPEPEPEPAPPAWKQPTGSHDAYGIGDRVTFNGKVYESLIANNSWSPTDYPAGWKEV